MLTKLAAKNEWRLFFISLGMVCLLTVGAGEILLRIRYGSGSLPMALGGGLPPHLALSDPVLGYTLNPGFVGRERVPGHRDVGYRVNREGLRDYDREIPKGTNLILAVGDSMTFGHGVRFESIWPTLLENKIREKSPDTYLIKGGVPGYSWKQIELRYRELARRLGHHDLVIFGFTVDAGERLKKGYEVKGGIIVKQFYPNLVVLDGLVYEKQSRHEIVNRADAILRKNSYFFRWFNQKIFSLYHQTKKNLYPLTLPSPPKGGEGWGEGNYLHPSTPPAEREHVKEAVKIFDSVYKTVQAQGAKMLVLLIARPGEWRDEIEFYEKTLSQKGVDTLDLSKFEDTAAWRFTPQGHWNEFGNREVAEKIYEFIFASTKAPESPA